MAKKGIYTDLDLKGNIISDVVLENATFVGTIGVPVKKKYEVILNAGQLLVTIPELPVGSHEVTAEVNGIQIEFTLVGVNFTITEYTSGTIESGWNLKIYYFK